MAVLLVPPLYQTCHSFPSESVQPLFLTRPQGVHERFGLGTRLGIHLLESIEQVSQRQVTLLQ